MAMVSFTSTSTTKLSSQTISLARKKEEDGEISVFGAEKYFNRGMDEECPKPGNMGAAKQHQEQQQYKKEKRSDMKPISINHHGAPSTHSVSSWNSQSALLQSAKRNPSIREAKKARAKSFLASLRCKCVCSDKNSVDVVEEQAGEISFRTSTIHAKPIPEDPPIKTVTDSWAKEETYVQRMDKLAIEQNKESSFSLSNPSPPKMQFMLDDDQKARKSLEVFGSPMADKRKKSLNIESRLAKLAREAIPRMLEEETAENGVYNNESGSDASSDLFEIESLKGKANPFSAVLGSDVPSGCVTPTTCYAPSEASIEWSVITASAVDLTIVSDFEEQRPTAIGNKTKPSKEIVQRRHPNIMLNCKSHKSVRVAGDAYIASHSPRTRHSSTPVTPVTRFQAGNKMEAFDSRQQHGLAKHQLKRSRSPRASHILYIQ